MNNIALFLGQAIRRPSQISAVVPSSRRLARAMVRSLGADTGLVAELGPGTGNITREILARGVAPADLTLFELNPVFCHRLAAQFPGVRIENRPAQDMAAIGVENLGAIVSSLPLLSMPAALQHAILRACLAALAPHGRIIQFTYGPRPPLDPQVQHDLGLAVQRGPQVLLNMPPARVYSYTRHQVGIPPHTDCKTASGTL